MGMVEVVVGVVMIRPQIVDLQQALHRSLAFDLSTININVPATTIAIYKCSPEICRCFIMFQNKSVRLLYIS